MGLGQLTVSLGLDASEFISGMSKSELQAKRFSQQLERNIASGIVKAEIAINAFVKGAGLAVDAFKTLTTGAANFKDLEETTGAAAESIASLAVSAATAGVDINDVAGATQKLTKNLVGVDDESKAAGAALKALNINVEDFKKLDPVAQYEAIGKALSGYADGAQKVAVAQALFGKSGAEQLKVFKALEEAGGRQTILTQRQIELADAYADRQARSAATLRLFAQAAASEALPALTDLTKAFTDVIREMIGVDKAGKQISANGAVQTFAEGAADAAAFLADSLVAAGRVAAVVGGTVRALAADVKLLGQVALAASPARGGLLLNIDEVKSAFAERNRVVDESGKTLDNLLQKDAAAFRNSLSATREARKLEEAQRRAEDRGFTPKTKPQLDFDGPTADRAAILRKQLDGQVRAIREFAEQQREALEFANRYSQGEYEQGLLSQRAFFDAQDAIRKASLSATVRALDDEEAALRRALRGMKGAERIESENKIADVVAKRADAERKAGYEGALALQQNAHAARTLRDRYDDLRSTILQLSGDIAGASTLRISGQVEEAKRLLGQLGKDPAEADRFRMLLTQTQALSDAQRQYGVMIDRSSLAEESLLLAAEESGQHELETMRAVGAARAQSLRQLGDLVAKANDLALALGTPEAIQFAMRLGVEFDRAAAKVDPLLLKIKDVGAEAGRAIASGFENAALEGKGFLSTLHDIDKQLARIALNTLVTKPFEKWLNTTIGGNGQPSGGGGLIGRLFGLDGHHADGLDYVPFDGYVAQLHKGERVQTAAEARMERGSAGRGGRNVSVTNHFTISGPVSRQTQQQIAVQAGRAVAAAMARGN